MARECTDTSRYTLLTTGEYISWAGHHAATITSDVHPKCLSNVLPLFHEQAHTLAMVRHSMTLVQERIQHFNPGQVPVVTIDQPVYALTKHIQWRWPHFYGEDRFVIALGSLRIEMALLQVLGDCFECSEWSSALVNSNITTSYKDIIRC